MKCIGEELIKGNPEFLKLFQEMEHGVMRLMEKLEIFPPELIEIIKQQEQAMQSTGMSPGLAAMGFPQNSAGGGFGPNSNPMEVLQMQQLQQFQSMFGGMGFQ
jgi:hypothetical protein